MKTRREVASKIIAEVLATLPADVSEKDARKAISEAYPWGERAMHPYKVWLSAVKVAMTARYRPEELPKHYKTAQLERKVLEEGE